MHRGSGLVQLLVQLNFGGLCSTFFEVLKLIKILITTPMTSRVQLFNPEENQNLFVKHYNYRETVNIGHDFY